MLKNEINLMLSSLINDKRAFKKFYKTGYFSYSKDKPFKGAAAIVNDKAVVSFLQDADDESKVIATASFQDNTTTVIQLMGKSFVRTKFGSIAQKYTSNIHSVINDIASVRKHCAEAEEKIVSSPTHFIKNIFSMVSQSSDRKLSKQDVRLLLENTLAKLHQCQNLDTRNEICPKVDTVNPVTNSTSGIPHSIDDKTPEI